jgi:cell division protein FtsW (lipid II flippase)
MFIVDETKLFGHLLIVVFIAVIIFYVFKKNRTQIMLLIICILIGINLYNYLVFEPQYIESLKTYNKEYLKNYKSYKYRQVVTAKLDSLYKEDYSKANSYNTSSSKSEIYNYDVVGFDNNNNRVSGNVDVDDDGGNGYILNSENQKIEIEVEWIGNGELKGTNRENNEYQLEVE